MVSAQRGPALNPFRDSVGISGTHELEGLGEATYNLEPTKTGSRAMAQATVKNQRAIIRNQEKIMRNQTAIVKNQKRIISNQGRILRKLALGRGR
jgi:hypothetical protein